MYSRNVRFVAKMQMVSRNGLASEYKELIPCLGWADCVTGALTGLPLAKPFPYLSPDPLSPCLPSKLQVTSP